MTTLPTPITASADSDTHPGSDLGLHVPYIDPDTGQELIEDGDGSLITAKGSGTVATRRGQVMDFIDSETYAESFNYQWNQTKAVRTQDQPLFARHREEMDLRTKFHTMDLRGMNCLEIGAGLGDDSAYLLEQGIGELHAVDLSGAIFRAAELVADQRVRFARVDANRLPFRPGSFDLVMCHRMMQHTPHPAATLARAARMVKPGGLLFVHSYHRSKYFMHTSKYKYRWLTTRIPRPLLWHALTISSPVLRGSTVMLSKLKFFNGRFDGEEFARRWSPWALQARHTVDGAGAKSLRRYETQITFDSLTPTYDLPMYGDDFQDLIEGLGFEILNIERRPWFPLWATARRIHGDRDQAD